MGFEGALDVFQKKKRERMAYMIHELYERGGKADINEFRGSIATNYGIRGRTQDEYFEDLKSAGVIDIHKNEIILLLGKDEVEKWLERQGIRTKKE